MFQGFYTLGSAMISENRNLNVISNNMANAATTGYISWNGGTVATRAVRVSSRPTAARRSVVGGPCNRRKSAAM